MFSNSCVDRFPDFCVPSSYRDFSEQFVPRLSLGPPSRVLLNRFPLGPDFRLIFRPFFLQILVLIDCQTSGYYQVGTVIFQNSLFLGQASVWFFETIFTHSWEFLELDHEGGSAARRGVAFRDRIEKRKQDVGVLRGVDRAECASAVSEHESARDAPGVQHHHLDVVR